MISLGGTGTTATVTVNKGTFHLNGSSLFSYVATETGTQTINGGVFNVSGSTGIFIGTHRPTVTAGEFVVAAGSVVPSLAREQVDFSAAKLTATGAASFTLTEAGEYTVTTEAELVAMLEKVAGFGSYDLASVWHNVTLNNASLILSLGGAASAAQAESAFVTVKAGEIKYIAADGDAVQSAVHAFKVTNTAGTLYYINLSSALAALTDGATLYLLKDYTTTSAIEITNTGSFTVDGNGYKFGVKYIGLAGEGANVTFKNITLTGTDAYHLFITRAALTLNFSGATLTSAGSAVHMNVTGTTVAFLGTDNKVTVTSNVQENRYLINAQAGTTGHTVTVEGGSFKASGALMTGFLFVEEGAAVTLNATGGTIVAPTLVQNGGSLTATLAVNYSGATNHILFGSGTETAWKLTFTGGKYVGHYSYTVLDQLAGTLSISASDADFVNVMTFANFTTAVTTTFTNVDIAAMKTCLIVLAGSRVTINNSFFETHSSGSAVIRADGAITLNIKGGVYAGNSNMPTFYMYPKNNSATGSITIDGIEAYGDTLLNIRGGSWTTVKVANSSLKRDFLRQQTLADNFIEIDKGSYTNSITSVIVQNCSAVLTNSVLYARACTVKIEMRDNCRFETTGKFMEALEDATVNLTVRAGYYEIYDTLFSLSKGSVTVKGGTFRVFSAPFSDLSVTAVFDGGVFIYDVDSQAKDFLPATSAISNLTVLADRVGVVNNSVMALDSSLIYYGGKPYYIYTTATASNTRYDPTTVEDAAASVYFGDEIAKSGIRFTTVLSEDMISYAATQIGKGKTVKYGTLIAPMDYVVAAGAFTVAALDKLSVSTAKYEKIEAVRSIRTNDAGHVIAYTAALVNLKPQNYNRMFAAISYVEIDGTMYYGAFNEKDNVRSASEIATVLLSADTSDYSDDEISVLNAYAAVYPETPYVLVVDDALSVYTAKKAEKLYDALGNAMTIRVPVVVDSFDLSINATEILVGKTNRAESREVLATLGTYGYAIAKKNDKIVIVGTTDVLTAMALDLFISTYVDGKSNLSTLSVTSTTKTNVAMLEMTSSFNFVYQNGLDATINVYGSGENKGSNVSVPGEGNREYNYDYPVLLATMLRNDFCTLMGIEDTATVLTVGDATTVTNEVLIGKTNRSAMTSFLNGFDADTYGVSITGGKILLGALTDTALAKAADIFRELIAAAYADGKIILPASYTHTDVMAHNWVTDFPRPTTSNLTLTDSIPVGDNSLLFVYTGSGVTSSALTTYCNKLTSNGYTLYMENTVGTNVFRTYVNYAKNHTLHVTYSLYDYTSTSLTTTYADSIRIVSASLDDVTLPDAAMLKQDLSYEKVIDSRLTVMRLNWMPGVYEDGTMTPDEDGDGIADELNDPECGYGNPYIITLEDGSFVVVDGGYNNSADMKRMFDLLNALHKEATGADASTENPIRIAAWYLTHDHGDHYQLFYEFLRNREYNDKVVLERLIANFASDEEIFNAVDSTLAVRNCSDSLHKLVEGGCQYIKVHTGQKFYIANATFEVIGTHEDVYPHRIARFNDTSTVIRVTLDHTDGNGKVTSGASESILFLGDAERLQSNSMVAMFGTALESDIVQVSHHAGGGATLTLYKYALTTSSTANKVLLVPQSRVYYYANMRTRTKSAETGWGCTYGIANYASVKYIFINDDYNTTLVLGSTGFNYEMRSSANPGGFYNLYDNTAMTWSTNVKTPATSIIKK